MMHEGEYNAFPGNRSHDLGVASAVVYSLRDRKAVYESKSRPSVLHDVPDCLQVKYKEEYEKHRGKSQMEFVDTQTYKVSKEAQRIQSEVT